MLFAQRFRKAASFVGIGVKANARELDAATPQILSGAGAPTASVADGSLYIRTDGTAANDSLYQRIAGSWAALDTRTLP